MSSMDDESTGRTGDTRSTNAQVEGFRLLFRQRGRQRPTLAQDHALCQLAHKHVK